MIRTQNFLVGALALAIGASVGLAQIERLDLEKMVARTDNAVHGVIVDRQVFRVDHPVDGPELYFTTLTVSGRSLLNGNQITVDVTYPGGFINEQEGVWNSEAPSKDDVKLGNEIVAFYRWSDNMGGGVAANTLYASHGGLYRTVNSPGGVIALGRGEGYAIDSNRNITQLETAVRAIRESIEQGAKRNR